MGKEKGKGYRPYYIVLIFLGVLIVFLGVVDIYLIINPPLSYVEMDMNNPKPYMDLTKEEALGAYIEMSEPGYIPKDYISEKVLRTDGCEPMNAFIYSYEYKSDVERHYRQFADMISKDRYEFQGVVFVDDYYAVASALMVYYKTDEGQRNQDEDEIKDIKCERAFSFNKKYYNYSKGLFSHGFFVDTSADFVKKALPVLVTSDGGYAKLSTIYDYGFEEDDNSITLNIYSIVLTDDEYDAPVDTYIGRSKFNSLSFSLKLRMQRYRYDKAKKQAGWVYNCDECTEKIRVIKTFPLTRNETMRLIYKTNRKAE